MLGGGCWMLGVDLPVLFFFVIGLKFHFGPSFGLGTSRNGEIDVFALQK